MKRNKEARLNAAERRQGKPDQEPFIIFWSDSPDEVVSVDGEKMTQAEFNKRYPDAINIEWPENDKERG